MPGKNDELMTTQEVSDYIRIPVGTLRYWRFSASEAGPQSIKVGPKRVAYWRSEIDNWLLRQQG